jgi:hypothetical protein
VKATWHPYKIKAAATEGTLKIEEALKAAGYAYEYVRSTPAKGE